MTHLADLPVWAAIPVALFLLLGASLALIGSIGFVRLRSFYERVHAPTLGTSMGIGFVLLASMLCFTVLQSRPALHEIRIAIFMVVTTPITLMLLARAALYRDRSEGSDDVPAAAPVQAAAPLATAPPATAPPAQEPGPPV